MNTNEIITTHLGKVPSTIFEVDEDKSSSARLCEKVDDKKEVDQPAIRSRLNSTGVVDDEHQKTLPTQQRTIGRRNTQSPSKVDDQGAIDNYYEKNQYSITGRYHKNEDTLSRIPRNFEKVASKSRQPSLAQKSRTSATSRRSQIMVPIAGASENRFIDSIYWLAHQHRKIGLRHFMMLALFTFLTLAGAFIVFHVERPAEEADVAMKLAALKSKLVEHSMKAMETLHKNRTELDNVGEYKDFFREAYKDLLIAEDRYKLSNYRKHEDPEHNMWWGYWEGVFYTTDIFMTVSYGVVPTITARGRVLAMLYGCLAIPLAVVVMRDLGQWYMTVATKLHARILIKWRHARFRKARGIVTSDDEEIRLPVMDCILMVFGFWFAGAYFIYWYDSLYGPNSLLYLEAVYCSFLTVTTIGLGDMVPVYVPRSPLWKLLHFFICFPVRVVNRTTYVAIEGTIFGWFTQADNFLYNLYQKPKVAPARGTPACIELGNTKEKEVCEETQPAVRTFSSFIHDRSDVYGGDFGRVRVKKSHLE